MSKDIPVISIDSGIPVPTSFKGKYPFKDLKVGESFLFPLELRSSIGSLTSKLRRESGLKFTIRKVDKQNARVWRVE